MTAAYLGVILFLTSRRSQVTWRTRAIGTGTGLLFGVVMYAVAPLAADQRRHRSMAAGIDGRPAGDVGLDPADRRAGSGRRAGSMARPRPRRHRAARNVRFGQGIAAGVPTNGTAAMFASALGTGTTALMLRSAWLLHWLNHGHQLTAIATYRYETNAAGGAAT